MAGLRQLKNLALVRSSAFRRLLRGLRPVPTERTSAQSQRASHLSWQRPLTRSKPPEGGTTNFSWSMSGNIIMTELIELTEQTFNRPFGILLIVAGLSFLLLAVLLRLGDIRHRMADLPMLVVGTMLIVTGAAMHIHPPSLWVQAQKPIPPMENVEDEVPDAMADPPQALPAEVETPLVTEEETAADPPDAVSLSHTFVTQFEFIWNDKERGMKQIAAFYRPVTPAGYKVFGHYVQANYESPNGQVLAVKVNAASADTEAVLAYPVRYERIWPEMNRETGLNGAIWRPIPPVGYRCLGDVATLGNAEPDRREVVCIREYLVTKGKIGKLIWDNRGKDTVYDIRVYSVLAAEAEEGMALSLFQGYGNQWFRRPNAESLPVLKKTCLATVEKE